MSDVFDKYRKEFGAEKVDNFLANFGFLRNNRTMRETIILLMKSGTGIELGFFDFLSIYQLEDGRFCVFCNTEENIYENTEESIYENIEDAVDQFLFLRNKYRLGFDFEANK